MPRAVTPLRLCAKLPAICRVGLSECLWVAASIFLHLLCAALLFRWIYTPQPATAAPKLITESLELTLAEIESDLATEAVTPEVASAAHAPQPEIAPYLTAPDAPVTLPEPPPPLPSPIPETNGFPMPELPLPALPDQPENLPEITLPPLQSPPVAAPPQQATGATARLERPELITDLSALRKSYPTIARQNGWEGTVTLRLKINAKGRLEDVEVIQSSGYSILDKEAAKMLRRARFRNGPGELIQSISYSLDHS